MKINILYEDNHLIAIDKPSGIPTQPSQNSTTSLEECVKALIKTRDQKKGGVFLHAIHRLDGATSGIVLFAKTQKALSRLNESLRKGSCEKEYLAIVQGEPPLGAIHDVLFHGDHKAIVVAQGYPEGKEAILTISSVTPTTLAGFEKTPLRDWAKISCTFRSGCDHRSVGVRSSSIAGYGVVTNPNISTVSLIRNAQLILAQSLSLLHITLQTGRYHQIRAQLAHRGFPIVGDTKYGSPFKAPFGIALHHYRFSFCHPTHSEKITLLSEPSWLTL